MRDLSKEHKLFRDRILKILRSKLALRKVFLYAQLFYCFAVWIIHKITSFIVCDLMIPYFSNIFNLLKVELPYKIAVKTAVFSDCAVIVNAKNNKKSQLRFRWKKRYAFAAAFWAIRNIRRAVFYWNFCVFWLFWRCNGILNFKRFFTRNFFHFCIVILIAFSANICLRYFI